MAPGATPPEVVAERLWQLGATAVEHRCDLLVAGFTTAGDARRAVSSLAPEFSVRLTAVAAPDGRWSDHGATTSVAGIEIGPSRLITRPGPDCIVIDAAQSFGSGSHVSTRLAVELVAGLSLTGCRVLDVGTGSGVLGIVAARRGASMVRMVDIDYDAVTVARANVAANGVGERCEVFHRGPTAGDGPLEVVVANLLRDDHLTVAPAVHAAVVPGGVAVVSGLLVEHLDAVLDAHPGWKVTATAVTEGWVGAVLSAGEARLNHR